MPKKSDFQWTPEAEEAFKQMKKLIAELPALTAPKENEELIIYLAAAKEAISAVLMTDRGGKQIPPCSVQAITIEKDTSRRTNGRFVITNQSRFQSNSVQDGDNPERRVFRLNSWRTEPEKYYGAMDAVHRRLVLRRRLRGSTNSQSPDRRKNRCKELASNVLTQNLWPISYTAAYIANRYQAMVKSINEKEILDIVEEEGNTWMTPISEYLTKEILPEDKKKARAVRGKAANMHSGPRMVVAKKPNGGYTGLTMIWMHRKLDKGMQLTWGIDIAEPFPEGPGKVKFLIVAIDYFTKWIEAKAVATITGNQVKKFVWDNIVCRFGLPGEIISDNGKQFRDNPFKDWCEKLCIRQCFASVKHPQANGLVERANRSLGEGIKAKLDERSKDWIEELPHVLWAHRTMIKSSNGETPFSLTYGTEAVIPAEIGMPTLRTAEVDTPRVKRALGNPLRPNR
ncbi:reverse transcriptase domain-containing protein [Tanacetum coccineum]